MPLYNNQSLITITLDTGIDLTAASNKRILYKKPNGIKGYWPATSTGNTLTYNVQNGDIDQVGIWTVQAYVEIGGLKSYGGKVEIAFEKPLDQM
jgi:hypothetical protein